MHRVFLLAASVVLAAGIALPDVRHVPASYATVQAAIDSSSNGDTVLVERGTYYENVRFHGKKVLVASQFLFSRSQADVEQTVINGSQPSHPDTASCVLFISGEDTNSVLEGFTLTGGKGTLWRDIHNNNRYREGGGILLEFTSPIIRYNIIRNNDASNRTGGSSAGGGGIRIGDANPRVIGNVIAFNRGRYGGGIVLNYTAATIRNNIIYRNTGGEDFGGGGIWGANNGSGLKFIENNTIVENSSVGDGGGIQISATSATIRNNIVWGNTAPVDAQLSLSGGSFGVSYNDVQGGYPGFGNIDADPKFMDTTHYLQVVSPCVDAGDPAPQYSDPEDTASPGSARAPSRGTLRNDMGAFGGPSRSSLYTRIHLNAPRTPANVQAYSDYLTPSSIAISWNDPTTLFNGSPLSAFTIHLYRDSVLIASVDSGVGAYVDTGRTLHQQYSYLVYAVTAIDSSPPARASAIAGGSAFPRPPAGFVALDASAGVLLQWFNPSRQADGTPLNDLAHILIYRDGLLIDSIAQSLADTGLARSYGDTSLGYHVYALKSGDDETPRHYSASTASLFGYGGVTTSYAESFENGRGNTYATGAWDTTSAQAFDGSHSLTDSPGGNYTVGTNTSVLLPPVIVGPRYVLQFETIAIIRGNHYAYVEISTNHRTTFSTIKLFNWGVSPLWSDAVADPGDWLKFTMDLSAYEGDTATIRLRFQPISGLPADGWYVDDIAIGPMDSVGAGGLSVTPAWNMISVPVKRPASPADSVYPGAGGRTYAYNGSYYRTDSLRHGVGYWSKFDSARVFTVSGIPLARDTFKVAARWNMIGAISYPVDSSAIKAIPPGIVRSSYFSYDPDSGYIASQTLMPGKAYWVKSSQAGRLVATIFFPSAAAAQEAKAPAEDEIGRLVLIDARGRTARLPLLRSEPAGGSRELPPVPPLGAFDVRFESNDAVAVAARSGPGEYPILLQSVQYPLRLEWRGTPRPGEEPSILIGAKARSLIDGGAIVLEASPGLLALRTAAPSGVVPGAFALSQNYPNPFNPSTVIRYQLAADARVSLKIYDVLGEEVAVLRDGLESAGTRSVVWNAAGVPSGVYYCRMEAGAFRQTTPMLLMR